MKCIFCGRPTETLTSMDEPICEFCVQTRHFHLCTELGKYIASPDFSCDYNCADCEIKNEGRR